MLRSVNYGSTQSFAGGRVAVMPSVGRIKQLSVLGVAAAVLAISASSASAAENDVWLWACHGPDGAAVPLKATSSRLGTTHNFGNVNGFDADGNACTGAGGLTAALTAPVRGNGEASASLTIPAGLAVKNVLVNRATHGFGAAQQAGNAQTYFLSTQGGTLESMSLADAGHADKTADATYAATPQA